MGGILATMFKHDADPLLIGLVGGPGAGKDTVSGLLTTHHDFRQHAFADALRDLVYVIDPGWAMALDTLGYDRAKHEVTGFRDRLVEVGNAAREYIQPFVWIDALDERVQTSLNHGYSVVVSDVRFHNEAKYIRANDGIVIGVDRPAHNPETDEAHEVFIGADDWLLNHDGLYELRAEVDALVGLLDVPAAA